MQKRFIPIDQHWPDTVYVHQWAASTVSRGHLGFYDDETPSDPPKLEGWYDRIKQELDCFDRSWSIGIITHEQIENELAEQVRSWGFHVPEPKHFFNLRGSNDFEDCQALVILGCPIPNLAAFQEECEAFLYDEPEPLIFKPNNKVRFLEMRDGRKYPVRVFGHWEGLVSKYYWQKCGAELLQAIHRLRPYVNQENERHIFLFTNMPVKGVKVDKVIHNPADWKWQAAKIVEGLLADKTDVKPA